MKVLHITPAFHPAHLFGGPAESVYQLCRGLVSYGCEIRVLTTNSNGPNKVLEVTPGLWTRPADGVHTMYCKRWWREDLAPSLVAQVPGLVRWADVVHLTMVYSLTTIPALMACKRYGRPLLWSPRGSLQRWSGSRRVGMKKYWDRFCAALLPAAAALHVTSAEEAAESLGIYPHLETVIIPNGVEMPASVRRTPRSGVLRMVYIGRLHPKKGLENLLDACYSLAGSGLAWSLGIAGAGDPKYEESLRARARTLGIASRTQFIGVVTGQRKTDLFESADVAVFPSHTENFALVIAEALAHGVPVIASRGTPWGEVVARGCGLWVDNGPRSLRDAILRMSAMPLSEMGHRGREWMLSDFTWNTAAREMLRTYYRLAGRELPEPATAVA